MRFLGFPRNGYDLPGPRQPEQVFDELFDRADAVAARGNEHDGCLRVESQMFSRFRERQRRGEERVDGDARHAQFFSRHANVRQIFRGLLDGQVVAIHGAAEPHGVDVVIRDHDGAARAQFFLGDEPGDDFRGQEVRGHAEIRLDALEQADHRAGV